jgi:glycosyltransferase involved in cell wall biosynthesis
VAAAIGGLAEFAGPGVSTFPPGDVAELAAAIIAVLSRPREATRQEAKARFDREYSPDAWYGTTMAVFDHAVGAAGAAVRSSDVRVDDRDPASTA